LTTKLVFEQSHRETFFRPFSLHIEADFRLPPPWFPHPQKLGWQVHRYGRTVPDAASHNTRFLKKGKAILPAKPVPSAFSDWLLCPARIPRSSIGGRWSAPYS
jgi:hypothetical protein